MSDRKEKLLQLRALYKEGIIQSASDFREESSKIIKTTLIAGGSAYLGMKLFQWIFQDSKKSTLTEEQVQNILNDAKLQNSTSSGIWDKIQEQLLTYALSYGKEFAVSYIQELLLKQWGNSQRKNKDTERKS